MDDEAQQGTPAAETNDLLRQILRWVRFQSLEKARQLIEEEVAQDSKRILVFELTDGTKGRPEIFKISKVPSSTIQTWWDRWYRVGLLEPSPKRKGMVRKVCGLEDVGLSVPNDVKAILQGKANGGETSSTTVDETKAGQNQYWMMSPESVELSQDIK